MYDNPLKPGNLDANAFTLNVTLPAFYNYTTKSLPEWNAEVGNTFETNKKLFKIKSIDMS